MTRLLRCGWLVGGLMLGVACGTERPVAPSAVTAAPTINQPSPPSPGLPSGAPVATYVTPGSRFLLYEGGEFGLQYNAVAYVYRGTYRQDDATVTFRFDAAWTWEQGWSCLSDSRRTQGLCPFATGTLNGDLLDIRFGDSMQHSDFDNAVYRRTQ